MSVSLILLCVFLTFGFVATQFKNPEKFGFKKWDDKRAAKKTFAKRFDGISPKNLN